MTHYRQPSQSAEPSLSASKRFKLNTGKLVPEERLKALGQEVTEMKDKFQKSQEESTESSHIKKN